jgi:subtilisin family serine protease
MWLVTLITLLYPCLIPAGESFSPTRILVQPRPGSEPKALLDLHSRRGHHLRKSFARLGGLQVVELSPGTSVAQALAEYRALPNVSYAEPDFIRELAQTIPNDPRMTNGQSWGLHNTGQNGGLAGADIDAPEAWDLITSATNVVVAVLDTGLRFTHEDLATNLWSNPLDGSHGWNALMTNTSAIDDEGHGTLVSGILGAAGNNGKGMAGVAWRTRIMALKCFNSSRTGVDSDIIECIEFARTNGAQIINASWGGYGFSVSLSNAIYSAREAGILFACAAGNDALNIDTNLYYPASYEIDNIVSVGASTRLDTIANISNWGAQHVDLFAPGDQIYSCFFPADNSYLGPLSGTSFSAPYVAGALALLKERFPGERHTVTIGRLFNGVDPAPAFAGKCVTGGRLNLYRALSPALRLRLQVDSTETRITVNAGAPGRTVVLEESADLASWLAISTNVASAAGMVTITNATGAGGFFQARAAP